MIKVIEKYNVEEFEKELHDYMSKGFALVQCFVVPSFERNGPENYEYYTTYTAVLIKQTQVAQPISVPGLDMDYFGGK